MRELPNLLPTRLLVRRSRRIRVKRWLAVLLLELLLGVFAALVSRYDYANPATQARRVIDSTVGQIDVVSTALAASERELQQVQQRLAVAGEVAGKPDWSIVLGAIAWRGEGLVRLESTQLMAPISKESQAGRVQHRVSLIGNSETRRDVTRFIEGLEQSGIFSQVRITQTQAVADPRPDEPKHERVGFTIEAWLTDGGAP